MRLAGFWIKTADYGMGLWPIFYLCEHRASAAGSRANDRGKAAPRLPRQAAAACGGCRNPVLCEVRAMRNEQLTELIAPAIADLGLECLGVEYSPSHGNSLVRVYIDCAERAVTVDDCEA
ncbi:MAG: hypothetical protein E6K53_15885, partial [Gammaproteobacteria bacterium]